MKYKKVILPVLLTVILFVINIFNIDKNTCINVIYDEFGYWTNAAYFSGLNWMQTLKTDMLFYSYGYSLLLTPLFWIFNNTESMYKAGIVLNSLMICGSFWACYAIAKKISTNINDALLAIIAFVLSLYPSYLLYSSQCWAECTIIFCFWLLLLLYFRLADNINTFTIISISILSVYIYIVHQRTLSVLVATIICFLLMKIYKKISWKPFFMSLLIISVLLIVHQLVKTNLFENVYVYSAEKQITDYSGQFNRLITLFDKKAILDFICNIICHLYYANSITFLLFFMGLITVFIQVKKFWLERHDSTLQYYPYLFILLALLGSFFISSIYMIKVEDDITVHLGGRYIETVVIPIMLIGFLGLISEKNLNYKYIFFNIAGFIFISILTYIFLSSNEPFTSYNIAHASNLFVPLKDHILIEHFVKLNSLFTIIIFIMTFLLIDTKKSLVILSSILLIGAIYFNKGFSAKKNIVNHTDEIIEYIRVSPLPVAAVLYEGRDFFRATYCQYRLYDKPINGIKGIDELDTISDNTLLIATGISNGVIKNYKNCLKHIEGKFLFADKIPANPSNMLHLSKDLFCYRGPFFTTIYQLEFACGQYYIFVEIPYDNKITGEIFINGKIYSPNVEITYSPEKNINILKIPLTIENEFEIIDLRIPLLKHTEPERINVSISNQQ